MAHLKSYSIFALYRPKGRHVLILSKCHSCGVFIMKTTVSLFFFNLQSNGGSQIRHVREGIKDVDLNALAYFGESQSNISKVQLYTDQSHDLGNGNYSSPICNRLQLASDVISSTFVKLCFINKATKFGDPGLHHWRRHFLTLLSRLLQTGSSY